MRRILFGSILIGFTFLLAACSTPSQTVPVQQVWSEESFGDYMSDLVEGVAGLIDEKAAGLDAITSLPTNAPGLSESTVDSLDGFVLSSILEPLTNSNLHTLPRGIHKYDPYTELWTKTQNSDDLILLFPFGNLNATVSEIRLVIDWNRYAETIKVRAPYATKEVPLGLKVYWTKDGIKGGHLKVTSSWKKSTCGDYIYEVKSISIKGLLGHADLNEDDFDFSVQTNSKNGALYVDIDYVVNEPKEGLYGSNFVPEMKGKIWVKNKGDKAELSWHITAYAKINRGPKCFKGTIDLKHGDAEFKLDTKISGKKDTVLIDMDFVNFVETPHISVDIPKGNILVNGNEVVKLHGTLGDANKNYIVGDDLTMEFENGDSSSLEDFFIEQLGLSNLWFPGL